MKRQTVWIVERRLYEDRLVDGVFATAEAAMAAFPVKDCTSGTAEQHAYKPDGFDGWENGCDWDLFVQISPFEVQR